MAKNELTIKEMDDLFQYITKIDQLAEREPDNKNSAAWKKWNAEYIQLMEDNASLWGKALLSCYEDWKDNPIRSTDILKSFLAESGRYNIQFTEGNPESAAALHSQLAVLAEYGFANDKVSREMIARLPDVREINGQQTLLWGIDQSGRKHDLVPVTIALSNDDGQITTSKKITAYDDAVFTATANIIYQLRRDRQPPYYITPQDIWRRMNGITENRKSPSKKQLDAVCRSIDKMRFIKLFMDISGEIKAHFIKIDDDRITNGIVEDYYLPSAKVTFRTEKGKTITGYRFDRMPFLYDYNIAKGHILLVDYSLLDTSDTTGNEGYTIAFRNYLLREIALMYDHGRDNNKISYGTIYKATATPTPEERIRRSKYATEDSYKTVLKRTTRKDRDKIAALLESWKQKKWILDYETYKSGRTIAGVVIKLNPEKYTEQISEKK